VVTQFLETLNIVIYVLMAIMVFSSIVIVLRRLRGALFNFQYLQTLSNAENDGRQMPDAVRQMLHKKWLLVGTAWAAIKAKEVDDKPIRVQDRVCLQNGQRAYVKEIKMSDPSQHLVEMSALREIKKVPSSQDYRDLRENSWEWRIRKAGDQGNRGWVSFGPQYQRVITNRMSEYDRGELVDAIGTQTEEFVLELEMEAGNKFTFTINCKDYTATESRWVTHTDLEKEGDIERMTRVFQSAKEFQEHDTMRRWEVR
jgi:hypothetical protein